MLERERLIARVRQLRRVPSNAEERGKAATSDPGQDVQAFEARIVQLEQLVEGLQDSVHRESTRLSRRVAELEAQIHPAALGRALSEDARARGL